MLLSTTDTIPNKQYEILGVVTGNRIISIMSKTEITKAMEKMKEEARSMGADAVIGIKPYTTANNSTGVIGTAIKYIK
ncbi:MAG: heavy metal-binding domain-containing protein [Mycoplasma sp.]